MLKIVVTILTLAVWSEATQIVPLFPIVGLKDRSEEIAALKSKYQDFITTETERPSEHSLLKYNANSYLCVYTVTKPGQNFQIVFDTDSFRSVYFRGLINTTMISFSFKRAAMVLGDIDSSFYTDGLTFVPIASKQKWNFQMTAYIKNTTLCEHCQVLVDFGSSLTIVPESEYNSLMNAIGATFSDEHNSYTVNCNAIDSLLPLNLVIGYKPFTITPQEYIIKHRNICSPAFENIGSSVWILGDIFLGKHYTVLDFQRNLIGFDMKIKHDA